MQDLTSLVLSVLSQFYQTLAFFEVHRSCSSGSFMKSLSYSFRIFNLTVSHTLFLYYGCFILWLLWELVLNYFCVLEMFYREFKLI